MDFLVNSLILHLGLWFFVGVLKVLVGVAGKRIPSHSYHKKKRA